MANKQITVKILKNNGETTEFKMDEKDYNVEQIQADQRDPKIDTIFIGRNSYKKHSIQSIEVE